MKESIKSKNYLKKRRVIRTRAGIFGTAAKPRLAVFRSLRNISVQAIDDFAGKTLATADSLKIKKGNSKEKAKSVGAEIGKKLLDQKITTAVFDKRHYKYHGAVKELADAIREAGVKF